MQTKEAAKYTAKHNYWLITSETVKKPNKHSNNIPPISAQRNTMMEIIFINHTVLLRAVVFSFTELTEKLIKQRKYTTCC